MTDYERHAPPLFDHHDHDKGAAVRTILQGLILAGIIGVVGMLWKQNEATSEQNVALGRLQVQVSMLQASLIGLPDLTQRTTRLEANQVDLMRRVNNVDAWRDRLLTDNPKMKGWTR